MEVQGPVTDTPVRGLDVQKLIHTDSVEIIRINLQAGALFPEHTSPTDAILFVLQGELDFYMDDSCHRIGLFQYFRFGKDRPHSVQAITDSRFLIIRSKA